MASSDTGFKLQMILQMILSEIEVHAARLRKSLLLLLYLDFYLLNDLLLHLYMIMVLRWFLVLLLLVDILRWLRVLLSFLNMLLGRIMRIFVTAAAVDTFFSLFYFFVPLRIRRRAAPLILSLRCVVGRLPIIFIMFLALSRRVKLLNRVWCSAKLI